MRSLYSCGRAYRTRFGKVDSRAQETQFMHSGEESKESAIDKLSKYLQDSLETTEILKAQPVTF